VSEGPSEKPEDRPSGVEPPPYDAVTPRATLAGRVWVTIGGAVVLLVLLIIFIAENSAKVTISFLGAHGALSLGLALLIAALAGIVITMLVGTSRIVQLRREVRRRRHPTR
jgi:uncharacterized integral membrane protein